MGFAEAAYANPWQAAHPWRAQVNHRLYNQADRIGAEEIKGNLTPGQAARLLHEDNQIRREERLMASQNGGHITKLEQRTLNQQENKISSQIP